MFRQLSTFCGALVLAGAAVLMTADPGQAAGHGGGGHGGGGHGGGFGGHGGGFHAGGYHGGYGGYHYGGYRGGYRSYGYGGYPFYNYGTYATDNPYYYSMNNPYYWSGGGVDTDSSASAYDSSAAAADYSAAAPPDAPVYPDGYTSGGVTEDGDRAAYPTPAATPTGPDNRSHVTVRVPAGAEVWFDDTSTTQTGTLRQYQSPPLTTGGTYSYDIRARWNENGHEVTQTQQVKVTAGAHVSVNFPVPPKTTGQASAAKKG